METKLNPENFISALRLYDGKTNRTSKANIKFKTTNPNKEWCIDRQYISEIYTMFLEYYQHVDISLYESISDDGYAPLILKITHIFLVSDSDNNYDQTQYLTGILYAIHKALGEYYHISQEALEYTTVILECKNETFDKKIDETIKYSFSYIFHLPYARIAIKDRETIKKQIITTLKLIDIKSKLHGDPVGDWTDMIQVFNNDSYYPLYGSVVNGVKPKFHMMVSHIDHSESNYADHQVEFEDIKFTYDSHSYFDDGIFNVDLFDEECDLYHYLPLLLSCHFPRRMLKNKSIDIKNELNRLASDDNADNKIDYSNESKSDDELNIDESPIELAKMFINHIGNAPRTNKFNATTPFFECVWYDIGRALYNETKGEDSGFLIWLKFTGKNCKNLPQYSESIAKKFYHSLAETNITYKTLAWYARLLNRDQYDEWHTTQCMNALETALTELADYDIAKAIYMRFWLTFANATADNKGWYVFDNQTWRKSLRNSEISTAISEDYCDFLRAMIREYNNQALATRSQGEKMQLDAKVENITALHKRLKNNTAKTKIITECITLFKYDGFAALLDSNDNITARSNGVHEIVNKKLIFRSGKPEDYCSKCIRTPYLESYHWDHEHIKFYLNYINQVFPIPELAFMFRKLIAAGYIGRNIEKKIFIFSGDGDNSKTIIVKIMKNCFKVYAVDGPTQILTEKKKSSSNASPELAQARAARWMFMAEPDPEEKLRPGNVKANRGNDDTFQRFLHDNGGSQRGTHKSILSCNTIPDMRNGDKAAQDSLFIVPFLSTFVDKDKMPEKKDPNQYIFMKDPDFDRHIDLLGRAMAWVSVQDFKAYIEEGLGVPDVVKKYINDYWEDTDPFRIFKREALQCIHDNKEVKDSDYLTFRDIYNTFKDWYTTENDGEKPPSNKIAKQALIRILGNQRMQRWYGIRFNPKYGRVSQVADL